MVFNLFDGSCIELPDFPLYDSSCFILLSRNNSTPYVLIPFNNYISSSVYFSGYRIWSDYGAKYAQLDSLSKGWRTMSGNYWRHNSSEYRIIGCSDNIIKYKENLKIENMSFDLSSFIEVESYVLKPIVVDVQNDYDFGINLFSEIFDILPVLLVVLVSFIGIRKGISYLFSLLKKS